MRVLLPVACADLLTVHASPRSSPDLTPKHSTLNALRSAEDTRITLYDLLVDVANSASCGSSHDHPSSVA